MYYGFISVISSGRNESNLKNLGDETEMEYSMLLWKQGPYCDYSVTLDAPYDITNSKSANDEQQFIFYGGCFTGNLLMPTTKNTELSETCPFVCNNK
jgi:hypothetical protein